MCKVICHVMDCCHNKNTLCGLKNLRIGGSDALDKYDTECNSYLYKEEAVRDLNYEFSSMESFPNHISCESIRCCYNKNRKCDKNNVKINGDYITNYCDSFSLR